VELYDILIFLRKIVSFIRGEEFIKKALKHLNDNE